MAKDPPVGKLIARSRNDNEKKYEIGGLWRSGKYPGQYTLMLSRQARKSDSAKYPDRLSPENVAKVLASPDRWWFDIKLNKAEVERLSGGGRDEDRDFDRDAPIDDGPPPDLGGGGDSDDIPFDRVRVPA